MFLSSARGMHSLLSRVTRWPHANANVRIWSVGGPVRVPHTLPSSHALDDAALHAGIVWLVARSRSLRHALQQARLCCRGTLLVGPLHPAQRTHRARPQRSVQPDPHAAGRAEYENQLIVAEGDYVIAHGRFSGNGRPAAWVAADVVRIEDSKVAEHWDVLQDEATKAQSVSGLPMFGDRFPD
jgi:hypothetical protein